MFPKVSYNSQKKYVQTLQLHDVCSNLHMSSTSITNVYKVPTICLGLENRKINSVPASKGLYSLY